MSKVAVICGGAGGIGLALAHQLLDSGFAVAIIDRSQVALDSAAAQLPSGVLTMTADVTSDADVQLALDRVVEQFGSVSAWVNAAGYYPRSITRDVLNFDRESWRLSMSVNLDAAVSCSLVAARHMADNGGGSIVNVSSGAGVRPRFPFEYSVAKAALIHATKCMALSLASRNVRVNAVAPGPTATSMISHILADQDAAADTARFVPLGRIADPGEIAGIIAFLCSAEAAYVTGSIYSADGGTSLT